MRVNDELHDNESSPLFLCRRAKSSVLIDAQRGGRVPFTDAPEFHGPLRTTPIDDMRDRVRRKKQRDRTLTEESILLAGSGGERK